MIMKTALLSVYDKTGIVEFAASLLRLGFECISTGGTFSTLQKAGLPVIPIEEVTGFPEMLDGRVKTLHPKIHGGLLARRDLPAHMEKLSEYGIRQIDLLVVNLYPFKETVAKGSPLEECIEQIDIGGPAMLRSSAKNYRDVTVICDASDYAAILGEIEANGSTSIETRARLAMKVFEHTSAYDAAVSQYFAGAVSGAGVSGLPETLSIHEKKVLSLRYGENPHQEAALYGNFFDIFELLHGKELSFNNIVDIQASATLIEEFEEAAAAIIKHTNPCGCAIADTVFDAYCEALTTDPQSAYGGIITVNREVDATFAAKLNEMFSEVIIAPSYHPDALPLLQKKKDRRLLVQHKPVRGTLRFDMKTVANGYLCQTVDSDLIDPSTWRIATMREPSPEEMKGLLFAWRIVKHVKSNAIVYTNHHKTLGIGAGQMSRVDSSKIAVLKAQQANLDLSGSVVASDAYFPFADGLLEAVKAGATAVIEPGGSVRDEEVIAAANEHNIAMIFTGRRHFKH
jgi:phosphoribosylaminoimidazolecarboxamide formyltransferase / IMP cyclohydrolase